ncbi:MAG: ATP-binding cassette domain-containing protein, partial [Coriobacteriales bacterium]|nr:ATP-binding cassette domain-containing protein [Coriobacteriales bacterium]
MPAVNRVSLMLMPARRVALLGANGSGKSTVARLANALLLPTEGSVTLRADVAADAAAAGAGDAAAAGAGDAAAAKAVEDDASAIAVGAVLRELRSKVALVMQDPDQQIVASTVFSEVAFGPQNLGLPADEIHQRVAEALCGVGLSGFEQRDPNALSGGEKQRLVIAGALAMRPRFLVLDEPSSMLDAVARAEVLAAVAAQQQRGCGILQITHDLDEALEADTVLILEAGQLVFSGSPKQLLNRSRREPDWLVALGLALPAGLAEELRRPDTMRWEVAAGAAGGRPRETPPPPPPPPPGAGGPPP